MKKIKLFTKERFGKKAYTKQAESKTRIIEIYDNLKVGKKLDGYGNVIKKGAI